jgi:hypothetical protein
MLYFCVAWISQVGSALRIFLLKLCTRFSAVMLATRTPSFRRRFHPPEFDVPSNVLQCSTQDPEDGTNKCSRNVGGTPKIDAGLQPKNF